MNKIGNRTVNIVVTGVGHPVVFAPALSFMAIGANIATRKKPMASITISPAEIPAIFFLPLLSISKVLKIRDYIYSQRHGNE